ncbi:DUF2062 domain-containing protein [Sphingosinicella soli]|uniref:DUF2062 domain-containing protein n=1 Tax=Sphingosinicella soli TaxID=333708 RepID=A0A7W7B1K4_9SPHN|nr:DUF2062 domain-containing protein [Sphingosinicella soli]MBB4631338.1 hypothetical protein [Sphingosinicella soli]
MRFIKWLKEKHPSREAMLGNRWMRPFANTIGNPVIWHFNRKSVARGVALGMFFGLSIPFAQAPAAALFAVPCRANLAVAAFVTFISNPLTTPFIAIGAYQIGAWLLNRQDGGLLANMTADHWAEDLMVVVTNAPLPLAIGLFVIATLGAVIGYLGIHLIWRLWIHQRMEIRRKRDARRAGDGDGRVPGKTG